MKNTGFLIKSEKLEKKVESSGGQQSKALPWASALPQFRKKVYINHTFLRRRNLFCITVMMKGLFSLAIIGWITLKLIFKDQMSAALTLVLRKKACWLGTVFQGNKLWSLKI